MLQFREIFLLGDYEVKNIELLDEYLELIKDPYDGNEYSELHHILPRSMYPEYKDHTENLVRLKYSDHVEAHRLLSEIFKIYKMKLAHILMTSIDIERKVYFLKGDNNPAKNINVRKKISESKIGVPRPDLVGKQYFGASKEAVEVGILKMSQKLKGTVIVKDTAGNRFRVSVDDARYKSGELVSFNRGEVRPNSALKRPEVVKKVMATRNKSYEKFKFFSYDEMVDFLVEAHKSGKSIFPKPGSRAKFSKNYSGFCKRTEFDQSQLKQSVVQRLSKG